MVERLENLALLQCRISRLDAITRHLLDDDDPPLASFFTRNPGREARQSWSAGGQSFPLTIRPFVTLHRCTSFSSPLSPFRRCRERGMVGARGMTIRRRWAMNRGMHRDSMQRRIHSERGDINTARVGAAAAGQWPRILPLLQRILPHGSHTRARGLL